MFSLGGKAASTAAVVACTLGLVAVGVYLAVDRPTIDLSGGGTVTCDVPWRVVSEGGDPPPGQPSAEVTPAQQCERASRGRFWWGVLVAGVGGVLALTVGYLVAASRRQRRG